MIRTLWQAAQARMPWLQPLGNDGLREAERDALAAKYRATIGTPPERSAARTERLHS
jgi:hypothetical protein